MDFLHYSDYILLAILQSILLLATIIEYFSAKSVDRLRKKSLKKATHFIFRGIIFTLLFGLAALANNPWLDFLPLIVPTITLFYWAGFYKTDTDLLDENVINDVSKSLYEQKIILILKDKPGGLALNEIYDQLFLNNDKLSGMYSIIDKINPSLKTWISKESITELFSPLLIDRIKLMNILNGMKDKVITKDNTFFVLSAEVQSKLQSNPGAQVPAGLNKDTIILEMKNNRSIPISIFSINFTGNEIFYFNLDPGKVINQETYIGNIWIAKDLENKTKLGELKVSNTTKEWIIE